MLGDDWDPDGYELWRNSAGAWQIFAETGPNWPWADGLRHLVECIQSGARPMITPEHGFHALEIMIKAQESGRDGQARPIESTFTPPTFFEEGGQTAPHLIHDRGTHQGDPPGRPGGSPVPLSDTCVESWYDVITQLISSTERRAPGAGSGISLT